MQAHHLQRAVPTVAAFMTKRVLTVYPEMDIFAAIHFLLDHKISGAPVVESKGSTKLVGMLSELECMTVLANGAYYELPEGTVADYMRTEVVTLSPTTDVFSVAGKFVHTKGRRLPVVENGHLVGLVSRSDVLRASRLLWDAKAKNVMVDSGYLSQSLQAHMGYDAVPHLHKT